MKKVLHELDKQMLLWLKQTPQLLEEVQQAEGDELKLQQRLRQRYASELVRAAFLLRELRQRAKAKFSRAEQMWFDRLGLEQATSELVARHKAQRFEGRVWDFCCGVGGDTLGLAERCEEVVAVDRLAERCLMTRWNAEVYGVAEKAHTIVGDVRELLNMDEWVHLDPDRRSDETFTADGLRRRALRLEEYEPGYAFLNELATNGKGGAIKISPAANFLGRFQGTEIELISLHRECKEATVWFGELAGEQPFRATVLPAGASIAGDPDEAELRVGPLQEFVYDPDPAVVRAGLVDVLAEQFGLWRVDEHEEYLSGEGLVETPLVRAFRIQEVVPNNDRAIRKAFRQFSCHDIEIKSRRIPVNVEAVRRKLPRDGDKKGALILTRVNGKTRALICERLD